jgi:hypothetical protein
MSRADRHRISTVVASIRLRKRHRCSGDGLKSCLINRGLEVEFLPDLKPESLNRRVVDGNSSTKRSEPVSSRERACECGYT